MLITLAAMSAAKADNIQVIHLDGSKRLGDLIDRESGIDSLIVSGRMTDEDFFSKTKDAVKDYCTKFRYDTEKSLEAVNYEKTTPFITPDGNLGVAASVVYPEDSQFSGDSTRCFDLSTKDVFSIEG